MFAAIAGVTRSVLWTRTVTHHYRRVVFENLPLPLIWFYSDQTHFKQASSIALGHFREYRLRRAGSSRIRLPLPKRPLGIDFSGSSVERRRLKAIRALCEDERQSLVQDPAS